MGYYAKNIPNHKYMPMNTFQNILCLFLLWLQMDNAE